MFVWCNRSTTYPPALSEAEARRGTLVLLLEASRKLFVQSAVLGSWAPAKVLIARMGGRTGEESRRPV